MKIQLGDTSEPLRATLFSEGERVDLTVADEVRVLAWQGHEVLVDDDAPTLGEDDDLGVVDHIWEAGETDVEGRVWYVVQVTWPGGLQQTFPPFGNLICDIG